MNKNLLTSETLSAQHLAIGAFLLFSILALAPGAIRAQTCSCGGPPLLSSLEAPPGGKGSWQVGLTYEFSSISDLFDGSDEFQDDLVERNVNSGTLQLEYGLTNKFSLSATLSAVNQQRRASPFVGSGDFLDISGVGDALLLAKYNLVSQSAVRSHSLSLGGGVKVPLGKSRALNDRGVLIDPDMQTGSGAWDVVLWASGSVVLSRPHGINAFASSTARFPGTDDRFGSNVSGYQFGEEVVNNFGVGWSANQRFDLTTALRYRWANNHTTLDNPAPNSGGKWLNLVPGVNYLALPGVTLRASGQIPVFREVEGTQFTTSYSLSFSIFYAFRKTTSGLTRDLN